MSAEPHFADSQTDAFETEPARSEVTNPRPTVRSFHHRKGCRREPYTTFDYHYTAVVYYTCAPTFASEALS